MTLDECLQILKNKISQKISVKVHVEHPFYSELVNTIGGFGFGTRLENNYTILPFLGSKEFYVFDGGHGITGGNG